jgi:sodium-dependent dicarboxylate transporter 2/3/5
MNISIKRVVGIVLAAAIVAITFVVVPPEGLSHEGLTALGILLGGIVLWITAAVPLSISCVAILFLLWTLRVATATEVLSGFMTTVVLFVIAMFAFAGVMSKTNLTKRIVGLIMKWAGTSSKKVVIGFFVGAFVVSSFMSAVPVCAMFGGLALSLLMNGDEQIPEYRNLGRSLMIAIPIASLLGNIVTPAGNSINLLVISGLEQSAGMSISFLGWMLFGAPLAIIAGIISLILILKMFKVEDLKEESVKKLLDQTSNLGKMDAQEIKFCVIFAAMIILWLCSNFIPWPGVVDTALIGLIIMFLPGIDLLDGKEFIKSVNWDVVMMTGTLIALGGIVQSTGGVAWMVDSLLGDASMWPFLLLVLAMSLVPCIIHIFVPLAGAIYALSLIPLVSVALAAGISPLIPAMMVAIWMNFECILPTDTIFMLTYANGFYEFKDTIKIGIPLTIIVVLLTVAWVPLAAGMLG